MRCVGVDELPTGAVGACGVAEEFGSATFAYELAVWWFIGGEGSGERERDLSSTFAPDNH